MSGKTEATRLLSEGKELIKKGDYEKAEKMFNEALKKFTNEGNNRGVAESETHLGIALQYQGKLKQAKEHLERALKLHEDLDYKPGISRVYTNLGNINLLTSKNFEKSLELHQKALNISREAEDLAGEARALTNIGYVQFRQRKLDEALDTLNEALKIANKAKDDYIRAVALSNIGIILFNLKRYDEALEKHKEVAEIFEKWGNKKRLAIEHRQIGLILEKQNRYEEAAEHYHISQKLYDETGQKKEKKMVKSMLNAVKTKKRECPSCKTIILVPELKYCPICDKDL